MMRLSLKEIRALLRENITNEALGAMKMLDVVHFRLILAKQKKVEEILTAVRVIKGVATVSQSEPMRRQPNGTRVMEINATVDPGDNDIFEYIDAMARLMKDIPDLTTVVVKSLNGQPIRDASGQTKLVY
jgi:hypothetical protein